MPVQGVLVASGGMLCALLDHVVRRLASESPMRQKKHREVGEISMHLGQTRGLVQEGKGYHKFDKLMPKYKKDLKKYEHRSKSRT